MRARRPFFFIAGLLLAIAGCGSRNPETQAPADAAVSVDASVGSDTALSVDVGPTSGMLDGGVTPVSDTAVGLDGAFSPDGTSLVLDGAVSKGSKTGSVLFTTPLAAPALTAVTPLVEIEYDFSNQNNFSQLNPLWR